LGKKLTSEERRDSMNNVILQIQQLENKINRLKLQKEFLEKILEERK
jgi:hypothetical protein